jgi:hypothetical protein
MSAQWPRVAGRLFALLPTLPHWAGVQLFNDAAYDVSAATYATVGHATDGTTTTRGHYTKTLSPDGVLYIEQGSVACQITTDDDGPDITDMTTLIFGLIDDLEAAIRADRTLGVLSPEGTTDLTVDLSSMQTVPGASTTLAFSVNYYTVT